jgi:hypothetical protein
MRNLRARAKKQTQRLIKNLSYLKLEKLKHRNIEVQNQMDLRGEKDMS